MKIKFSHSVKIMAAIALFVSSGFATADRNRHFDYARVTHAKPIYQTVTRRIPVESCRIETVRVDRRHNDGRTLAGGLIGAAIGHKIGRRHHDKHIGAVAGAIIGASIADNSKHHNRRGKYRDIERCNTHYDLERSRELVGYDVTYRYHGEVFHTRTDDHPGKRIRVKVSVRPAY